MIKYVDHRFCMGLCLFCPSLSKTYRPRMPPFHWSMDCGRGLYVAVFVLSLNSFRPNIVSLCCAIDVFVRLMCHNQQLHCCSNHKYAKVLLIIITRHTSLFDVCRRVVAALPVVKVDHRIWATPTIRRPMKWWHARLVCFRQTVITGEGKQ